MDKITLEQFREMKDVDKVELINKFSKGSKTLTQVTSEHFAFTNIGKYMPQNATWDKAKKIYTLFAGVEQSEPEEQLTKSEVLQLKKILEAINTNTNLPTGEVANRSVRVYKAQFEEFSNWCKARGMKQSDAIYFALEQYMHTNA